MPADITVGVDAQTMNQACEAVYKQLYPRVFTGSQHVARDGIEFDVLWDVKGPPTVILEPPPDLAQLVRDDVASLPLPASQGHLPDHEAALATLQSTTFQLVIEEMTMTVKGEGEGTAKCRVSVYVQADSSDGDMTLRPVKAVGHTDNESDEWFLNNVILPEALQQAEQFLRGVKLPALNFIGLSLTPPVMLVTPKHVVAMANLAGKAVPAPPFPDSWPTSSFFALMSEEAKLRVARVATASVVGQSFGKSGKVDTGIGDAHYGATATVGGLEITAGSPGGTDVHFKGAIVGNVNAGVKVVWNFGVNYTLYALPAPEGKISLSLAGTTVRAETSQLDTFVLLIKPEGNPFEWVVSAITAPILQVITAAFSPLITKLFEGIHFDVWRIPNVYIDVAGVHLTVAPTDVHFASFAGQTSIEGQAAIHG